MATATITSQGQLTLPKAIRDLLNLKPGDRVSFRVREDQTVVVEPETVDLRSLRGALKSRRRGVTVEEMDEAVRTAVAGKPRKR
jgi:antitoxin PrlF